MDYVMIMMMKLPILVCAWKSTNLPHQKPRTKTDIHGWTYRYK